MSVSMKPGATTLAVIPRDASALGRGVIDLTCASQKADDRRDEDDASKPLFDHRGDPPLDQSKRAGEVGVDDRLEIFIRHSHEKRVLRNASVRHDDFNRAKFLFDRGNCRGERVAVGDVRNHGEASFRALSGTRSHGDAVPEFDELFGDRKADTAVSAGDEYGACCGHGYQRSGGRRLEA
jgi:hypothetical protein